MKIRSTFVVCTMLVIFTKAVSSDLGEEVSTTSYDDFQTENVHNINPCGAVFTEEHFVITSPNYPESYPSDLECTYSLKGPLCPTYYEFSFLNFDVEDSTDCWKDRFEIGEEDALCGNKDNIKSYFAKNGSLSVRFITDGDNSGKGYNISVIRTMCQQRDASIELEELTTELVTEATTETTTETITQLIESRNFPQFIEEESECCASNYNGKRFILTSPNFPYSLNKKTKCVYTIRKASDNVCRLRLNFLFFWLGFTNFQNNCPYGSLEIDGKYVCGCNNGIQLTTTFGNSDTKLLKFKTEGFYQKYYTGFVVEVIQDECPKKYSPEYFNHINNNCSNGVGYNNRINRVVRNGNIPRDFIERLQLINEKTEILDDDNDDVYLQNSPGILKSIYFFAVPEYNQAPSLFREREKTTYIDTNSITSILTNNNYFECSNWNQAQYNYLQKNYGRSLETCKIGDGSEANVIDTKDCLELNYLNGYFRSPGYPYYYPGNLNVCYRFRKQPGFCKMRMLMNDFQIEDSAGCNKDYLLMESGDKYCGTRLFKASWTIDLRNKDYEDMRFVTDDYHCGRGFSGVYQQILCQDITFPIYPTNPSIPPTTTTPNSLQCTNHIKERTFTIEVNHSYKFCTFTIRKSSKNVCKLNLSFEQFHLVCGVESLVIDGISYCGNLSGKQVAVNIYNDPKTILYRGDYHVENRDGASKIYIRGEQISDDCLLPEVPAERLLHPNSSNAIPTEESRRFSETYLNPQMNSKYLIALLNKQFKDICGIVTNTTDKELPPTFCEILMNEHNATKCIPLQDSSIDVPYKMPKADPTLIQDVKVIQGVEFNEIDCDKL